VRRRGGAVRRRGRLEADPDERVGAIAQAMAEPLKRPTADAPLVPCSERVVPV
jgi:hypothetical protein